LTLIDVTLSERPNRDLATIHDARTRQPFPMIRGDLRRWALATTMAEVILHLIPQHAGENGVFALLQKAWAHLNNTRHEASEDLLFLFELRILSFTGVLPPPDELVELPEGARDTLVKWLSGQWVPLASDVRLPVQRLLEGLIEEASGRPLRSRAFLDETLADGTL